MDNSELKNHIDAIIDKTFNVIKEVYKNQKERTEGSQNAPESKPSKVCSRILFPLYSQHKNDINKSKPNRISEQELRFIFVEQFYAYINKKQKKFPELINLYYSVETPTNRSYIFSKGGPKVVVNPKNGRDENGNKCVSARTDLTIYKKEKDNFIKRALIEFKAHDPIQINYKKDICKLINEHPEGEDYLKYFIQIIDETREKEKEKDRWGKIEKKFSALEELNTDKKNYSINYRCSNLQTGNNHTFTIENNEIKKCE